VKNAWAEPPNYHDTWRVNCKAQSNKTDSIFQLLIKLMCEAALDDSHKMDGRWMKKGLSFFVGRSPLLILHKHRIKRLFDQYHFISQGFAAIVRRVEIDSA
jgi:hypothetical protein